MAIDTHCSRCLHPAPDVEDQEYLEWEALTVGDDGGELIVCPDCITPEEQQAIDEGDMQLADGAPILQMLDDIEDGVAAEAEQRLSEQIEETKPRIAELFTRVQGIADQLTPRQTAEMLALISRMADQSTGELVLNLDAQEPVALAEMYGVLIEIAADHGILGDNA